MNPQRLNTDSLRGDDLLCGVLRLEGPKLLFLSNPSEFKTSWPKSHALRFQNLPVLSQKSQSAINYLNELRVLLL
jgi:hypothetical protein